VSRIHSNGLVKGKKEKREFLPKNISIEKLIEPLISSHKDTTYFY